MKTSQSEFTFIKNLQNKFKNSLPKSYLGIGDDCSAFPINSKNLFVTTTDLLIEKTHFKRDEITPYQLGIKAMNVNLSDLASKGAKPHSCFISLAIPTKNNSHFFKEFYSAIHFMCQKYKITLLGGDTSKSTSEIFINVLMNGTVKKNHLKKRSNAQIGDSICLTGNVGESGLGLKLLQEKVLLNKLEKKIVTHHLINQNHLTFGQWLIKQKEVHAMMDVSDGIMSDIKRICEQSKCGAAISIEKIPFSKSFKIICDKHNWKFENFILGGGEDYILMFTVKAGMFNKLNNKFIKEFKLPLYEIGLITKQKNSLKTLKSGKIVDFNIKGYDHFS